MTKRDSVKMFLEYLLRSLHGGNSSLIRISCLRVRRGTITAWCDLLMGRAFSFNLP